MEKSWYHCAMNRWYALWQKEMKSHWRSQSSLPAVILYVISTTFIVFASFARIDDRSWMVLYWIIVVLSASHAAQSAFRDTEGIEGWYYYGLCRVEEYFFAKVAANFILMGVIASLTFASLSLFAGTPVRDPLLFFLINVSAWIGLALLFSFLGFLNAKVDGQRGLLPLLTFPLLLPILLQVIKLSSIASGSITDTSYLADIYILLAVDALILALSLLLIRYLWQS